ncbi:hypothetical protein EVAR_12622_1 [Eumeta japonica]|uniref:Uncharacterized protein n=1 Tax=Eumeta variegata TaxID=151549 RepID=A0A4C1UET2_EUMVA|nr:hypothetical protein EVAR_12622_1 [Eumeta japonica]
MAEETQVKVFSKIFDAHKLIGTAFQMSGKDVQAFSFIWGFMFWTTKELLILILISTASEKFYISIEELQRASAVLYENQTDEIQFTVELSLISSQNSGQLIITAEAHFETFLKILEAFKLAATAFKTSWQYEEWLRRDSVVFHELRQDARARLVHFERGAAAAAGGARRYLLHLLQFAFL